MAEDEIEWVEYPPLQPPMKIEFRALAMLPCCEKTGVFWGRSDRGEEWAECPCGKEWPGYKASQHEQEKLTAEIQKRDKENNAATAA